MTSGAVLAPSSNVPAPISKPKKKNLNPIIIISPSSTALITMHNVKRFLEDSVSVPLSSLPSPDTNPTQTPASNPRTKRACPPSLVATAQ